MNENELLTQKELCDWLKIASITAYRWRMEGMPHIGEGRRVRYEREAVLEWLKGKGGM